MDITHEKAQEAIRAIHDSDFKEFVNESYKDKHGYAIRVNPKTGKKEMMVAGSRNVGDWVSNFFDAGLHLAEDTVGKAFDKMWETGLEGVSEMFTGSKKMGEEFSHIIHRPSITGLDFWRKNASEHYSEIAEAEGVDVVYGHSRGGAIVADMDIPEFEKVGLDAAMYIADDKDMLNIREDVWTSGLTGLFDQGLGLTGDHNVGVDYSKAVHQVWD